MVALRYGLHCDTNKIQSGPVRMSVPAGILAAVHLLPLRPDARAEAYGGLTMGEVK